MTVPPPGPTEQPVPADTPATAAAAAIPASGVHAYRLQLGAMRTPEAAGHEWERLKRRHADLLGALEYGAQRVDLGPRGLFYRIQAGPLADAAQAERRCAELKHRGEGCIIVKP
jgi:hypothetical protein